MSPSSTSNSERASSPWRLLREVACFAAVPAIVVLAAECALWRSGEIRPLALVARIQESDSTSRFQRALISQEQARYKLVQLRRRAAPRLLIAGSSRVLQIRSDMLPGLVGSAFNAGGSVTSVRAFEDLVDELLQPKKAMPETLLLGIDPWWFYRRPGARETARDTTPRSPPLEAVFHFSEHVSALRSLTHAGTRTWTAVLSAAGETGVARSVACIGIGALRSGAGFRPDGSYQYPPSLYDDFLANPVHEDRDTNVRALVQRGNHLYVRGAVPSASAVRRLAAAVARLDAAGVATIVYMPPLADVTERALAEDTGYATWWPWVRDELPVRLTNAGVRFIDVGSVADLGATDLYMIDGHHPSEVLNLLILARLATSADDTALGDLDVGLLQDRARMCASFPLAIDAPDTTAPK